VLSTSTPSAFLERAAKRFGARLCVNARQKNIADDWSFAYEHTQTRYVTLAHQDDIYLPSYVESCLRSVRVHPDTLIVFTNYGELFENSERGTSLIVLVKRAILSLFFVAGNSLHRSLWRRCLLSVGSAVPCPTVMYHKWEIGPFAFSSEYSINLDWDAWLRLAGREGAFTYVREKLLLHRIHAGSETTLGIHDERRRREDEALLRRLWPRPIAAILSWVYALSYLSNKA
jgi:hypothetical protein